MAKTALYYCEEAMAHDTGRYHPESPLRLKAIQLAFEEHHVEAPLLRPEPATEGDLLSNHTRDHVKMIRECCLGGADYPDPDTVMDAGSWDAALLSAGAGITACKAVLAGEIDNAFVMMRPPGHHAESDCAMGFCLFNNIAIAARWLRGQAGIKRVAILDFDVHHGNGTQQAFYNDDTVLFISLHEYPHFPGTGFPYERGKNDTNLNFQMPPGCSPDRWLETVRDVVLPQLESFAPDMFLMSAGFDGHRLDPLGNQLLEAEHYGEITRMTRHIADGRIVSFLEGGYHLTALGLCAISHVRALME
ncbi:MAG TPA: histone deacetylase [Candidatus Hydrogenedentes bacterium]|nr:histone deacetylase [Candidatus Hydrogenedentota bacterium]